MRVREETAERLVLTMVPWETWLISTIAGSAFIAMALFQPIPMPGWVAAVFFFLGVVALVAFLIGHAALRAEFSRPAGAATITQTRLIGGTTKEVIALAQIEAIETHIQTDSDDNELHVVRLVLTQSARRVVLNSVPLFQDPTALADRLAAWLGVPKHG